jgi:hypothetical protein
MLGNGLSVPLLRLADDTIFLDGTNHNPFVSFSVFVRAIYARKITNFTLICNKTLIRLHKLLSNFG